MRKSLLCVFVLAGCGAGVDQISHLGICEGYSDTSSSTYQVPLQSGSVFKVSQGNCTGVSHFGSRRYAYDFEADIGTPIVAARGGVVTEVVEKFRDGNGCPDDNHVFIRHGDGTVARYVHLTENGADVNEGESVVAGQLIGWSGNTGCSSGPHLHFEVTVEAEEPTETLPITFNNTLPEEARGLKTNTSYTAQ